MGGDSMIIIDKFLDCYDELKEVSCGDDFHDVVNPADGVTYPNINTEIPDYAVAEIEKRLEDIFGEVKINFVFMRRSPASSKAPHIAHTDNSMGTHSLMVYFADNEAAGTGMLRHRKTGIEYAPESQEFVNLVKKDQNDFSEWFVYDMAPMKQNRAAIFDAGKFHCALPVGGFGQGSSARCVLTCFFTVAK